MIKNCNRCKAPFEQGKSKRGYCARCRVGKPPIDAIPEGFTVREVATEVDAHGETQSQWIGARPASASHAEHVAAIPVGHSLKGVSTLVDDQGNVRAQWQKTNVEQQERITKLLEAMTHIADAWQGLAEPAFKDAAEVDTELLCVYPMGDPHLGMFSWAPETGNHFDLKIAEADLYASIDHLVQLAPSAMEALIVSVGDFFHADNRGNTTTGGTPVDSDGRWPKVLAAGIRCMRRMIDRCLEKHEHVTVICEIGNHDWHTSIMLATCLAQYYEHEPRVTIDTSPAKCHWFRFGRNLIGTTHGDTIKLDTLGGVMAADKPVDWGETEHRYWYTGHIHHDTKKELLGGVLVESFRTLAPADAWHRGQGYRSGRDMKCLILHRQWGEIKRNTVGISQVHARSKTNG